MDHQLLQILMLQTWKLEHLTLYILLMLNITTTFCYITTKVSDGQAFRAGDMTCTVMIWMA